MEGNPSTKLTKEIDFSMPFSLKTRVSREFDPTNNSWPKKKKKKKKLNKDFKIENTKLNRIVLFP